jgi:anti-anti-sigma regulatory factor
MSDQVAAGADDTAGPAHLKLPARFDTAACEAVAKELKDVQQQDLCVDASNVEVLMSQAAQLLLSAKRTWDEEGKILRFENMSSDCEQDLKTLGITMDQLASEKQNG